MMNYFKSRYHCYHRYKTIHHYKSVIDLVKLEAISLFLKKQNCAIYKSIN